MPITYQVHEGIDRDGEGEGGGGRQKVGKLALDVDGEKDGFSSNSRRSNVPHQTPPPQRRRRPPRGLLIHSLLLLAIVTARVVASRRLAQRSRVVIDPG